MKLLVVIPSLALLGFLAPSEALQKRQSIEPSISDGHWIDTWTSMPQLTEPANLPPPPFNGSDAVFRNSTIRQTLHMSTDADQIRIRISNAFGVSDLPITAVTVALPFNGSAGVSAIQPSTLQTVSFDGSPSFTIPNGALAISDPLNFHIQPQSVITVTIYLAAGQSTNLITSHPGSRTTSWFTLGNQASATNLTGPLLNSTAHWYFLSAVEAWSPPSYSTFTIIGDSITDGRGSTTDANNRWPDLLLSRFQSTSDPSLTSIAIANQAAGGNRILADGLGPNALGRIDRDVLSHSGVKYAMIFEGVNDIGVTSPETTNQTMIYNSLISAYQQMISRIHAQKIPVFGVTITPFGAPNNTIQPYSDPVREQTRQKVNAWIREAGWFDEVIDFDAIVRDPDMPERLREEFNSGDFLHPNVAGYEAMAVGFDLGAFQKWQGGVLGFM